MDNKFECKFDDGEPIYMMGEKVVEQFLNQSNNQFEMSRLQTKELKIEDLTELVKIS